MTVNPGWVSERQIDGGGRWRPGAGGGGAAARWRPRTAALGRAAVLPLALFGLAALLLGVRLGEHPPFAYNWEGYTAWRFAAFWEGPGRSPAAILAPTDGLMTDSGRGPLVGLPVALGVALGGFRVGAMRPPVALLAAGAVPLLWWLGRRLVGPGAALLAAVLLALSPVFLLYGRTATLVGPSLLPALLTALALLRVVERPAGPGAGRRLLALQGGLLLGIFAYAPVRLLWPAALGLLAVEAALRRGERRPLLAALAVTACVLPLALTLLTALTTAGPVDPVAATAAYFRARGEQLVALHGAPAGYGQYLRPAAVGIGGEGTPVEFACRLVGQNAGDLLALLLDRGTRPTLTDSWNPHGRLWPPWLAAGFAVGLVGLVWGGTVGRRPEDRLLLALAAGLTLPLLLTTRVHVGRLAPALPFLLLLAALGCRLLAGAAVSALARRRPGRWARALPAGGAALLLAATAGATWLDYRQAPPPTGEALLATTVAARLPTAPRVGLALVEDPRLGLGVEAVRAATLRLELDDRVRVVDLALTPDPPPGAAGDDRPPLYAAGVLGRLRAADLPDRCRLRYLVAPAAADAFVSALGPDGALPGCRRPARYDLIGA